MADKPLAGAGLRGQSAGSTALCTVGKTGSGLTYRGFDIKELAEKARFEEVAYLLLKGKLPNQAELDHYITKLKGLRGLPEALKTVLEQLDLLGEEVAQLETAIAATDDADARKKLQRRLRYFLTRQSTAEVQAPPADGSVGIGSRVAYRLNGTEKTITIVGGDEADPARGHIAFSAPLARALMGAEAGESVEYQGRDDAIAILAVEPDPEVMA